MIDLEHGIYWDESWSPVTGCSATGWGVGCLNCWSGSLARTRLRLHADFCDVFSDTTFTGWNGVVQCHEHRLKLTNGKPKVIALNWMGDLFNPAVPDVFIERVFSVMLMRPQHTFLLLTKIPQRMSRLMHDMNLSRDSVSHIWFGVSASNQVEFDIRVGSLCCIEGVNRWVSLEPLLEEVDVFSVHNPIALCRQVRKGEYIKWIAMGAESGPSARPMKVAWAEDVIDDCASVGIKCFYKQGPDHCGSKFTKVPRLYGSQRIELPFEHRVMSRRSRSQK